MNIRRYYILIPITMLLIIVSLLFLYRTYKPNLLVGWQIRDKTICQNNDGIWHEQLDGAIKEWCQLPTSDGGSKCTNSEQCEGLCVANAEDELAIQAGLVVGYCSEWDTIPDVYVLNKAAGIDGFDYIEGFRPYSEVSCEQFGGNWLSYYGLTNSIHNSCQLPTNDANKECTNSEQCEGVCLPLTDIDTSENSKLVGICSEWDSFVGGSTLENGVIVFTSD